MSVSPEGGGRAGRALDAEVNLVPFIDVMSCLVAFLLVTAVWTNVARLNGHLAVDEPGPTGDVQPPPIRVALLVTGDSFWVGTTAGERLRIDRAGEAGGLPALEEALERWASLGSIEVAADNGVSYEALVAAMDCAVSNGYGNIGWADPARLPVRFLE